MRVSDLARSIAFYEQLGLEIGDTYEASGELQWVALQIDHARLMLQVASAPIEPQQQAVLFYLYVQDLDAARAPARPGSAGRRDTGMEAPVPRAKSPSPTPMATA